MLKNNPGQINTAAVDRVCWLNEPKKTPKKHEVERPITYYLQPRIYNIV